MTKGQVTEGATSADRLHVLVGLDGSDAATRALESALDLFGPLVERLTIAAVLDYDGDLSNVPEAEQRRAAEVLDDGRARAQRHGVDADAVMLVGRPAEALTARAQSNQCDLVVVGPRGRGVSRFLFGSVARSLAKRAAVPVAVLAAPPETA
jgi:nucleotide-binding universal stress UspA family protein